MPLKPGTRLGPYEILAQLGAGGMGEVYKGRDVRLDRLVALKVLAPHLAANREARERFEREATTVAKLKHAHICLLYDIGKDGDRDYLVFEYLEGETLSQRLAQGPLPLDQVLQYSIEIADALDKAHHAGVTHRDIKPGNIMLVPSSETASKTETKLLDFGLAKLKQAALPANLADRPRNEWPTGAGAPTEEGRILGTMQYMAPEQVEGKVNELDARTDIFSFGATVYEMATGKKAFQGQSQASIMAAILKEDPPPVSSLDPPGKLSSPALDRVVKKCLAKEPERRWQSASDLHDELKWIREGGAEGRSLTVAAQMDHRRLSERLAWGVAALAVVVAIALGALYFRRSSAPPETMRFSVTTSGFSGSMSLSPDGRYMALTARDSSGQEVLWVRQLDSLEARPLPGTERADGPFWSPDSRFLGFFADGKLKKVEVSGGPVQTLADVAVSRGAAWNPDGVILFTPQLRGGLSRVSAAGGPVSVATTLDASRQETDHRFPQFLPDGRHFLYLSSTEQPENNGIYVGSLDSKETKRLVSTEVAAAYAPPGYLLFLRVETLMAQPFDAARLELTGEPTAVAEGVWNGRASGFADFSVSQSGVLAYTNADAVENRQLVWFDRGGRQLAVLGPPGRYSSDTPELSPDGKRLAVASGPDLSEDLWLLDLATGTSSRFTFDPARDNSPHWSPDGSRIAFRSNRPSGRRYNLYQKNSSGAGNEELLFENTGPSNLNPQDWSADGRFLVYITPGEKTLHDLWVLPLEGERKPFPYLETPANQSHAQFSPDGRWVAYASDESGRPEVYIQSFPTPGSKRQVSANGGAMPRWRGDGQELYYLAFDLKLMTASVRGDPAGPGLEIGTPTPLFQTRLGFSNLNNSDPRQQYDVTVDGQRFLLNLPSEESGSPITVILNWTAGLRR